MQVQVWENCREKVQGKNSDAVESRDSIISIII